jgi:molecular chaperone HtpG
MAKGTLKIHSENILPILKKSLYSDKDIFIRELVSNACDAMSKLKILRDTGACSFSDDELKIEIAIDQEKKLITIEDTGIGMNQSEVENYIAHLAFSGAEEFTKRYTSKDASDQIIGHFGLGFYSSFMVSSHVDLETLSYEAPSTGVFWSSDGSYDYTIEETPRTKRGTKITLHIDSDSEEFLEASKLKEILVKYCSFLPYPIFLNSELINAKKPLWLKNPSECTEADYLEFYRQLYPMDADPVFYVHLNVDYPFNLKGILYFPKLSKRHDFSKSNIQLYCNRVFVSDHCKDIMPEHLTMLKGAIDSPDIPLNVSRSALQMDKTVRQLSSHISKKVTDRLVTLFDTDKAAFYEKWQDVEIVVKWGILHDDKFYDRIKSCLIFKTTSGDWITLDDYKSRNEGKTSEKIYYLSDEHHFKDVVKIFSEKGIDVLVASSTIDTPLIQFLEAKLTPYQFKRIDGGIEDVLLDKSKEMTLLDESGKTQSVHLAALIKELLGKENVEVEAKSLASSDIPSMIIMDEQQRRMRDYFMLSQGDFPMDAFNKHIFVVNTNSPMILNIEKLNKEEPLLAQSLTRQLYKLSQLAQKELKAEELSDFVSDTQGILNHLLSKIS